MIPSKNFSLSFKEIKDLLVAWFILSLALSIAIIWNNPPSLRELFSYAMGISFLISLITVGFAFVLHELSHKFMAQRLGYWAEFRMNLRMLFFALFLAYAGGIIFAAPGAVRILGRDISVSENAKISIMGPLVNLIAGAFVFFPLSLSTGLIGAIGYYGMIINFVLAFFNLLPISVFDGRKILRWNKFIYLIVFSASIGGLVFSFISMRGF